MLMEYLNRRDRSIAQRRENKHLHVRIQCINNSKTVTGKQHSAQVTISYRLYPYRF
jgi:hypothetical protein